MNIPRAVALRSVMPATPHADEPSVVDVEAPLDRSQAWDEEQTYQMICENAYYRAERRGFAPGDEVADWLAAEQEIRALLGTPSD